MMSFKEHLARIAAVALVVITVCLCTAVALVDGKPITNCRERDTIIPEAPVYPGSVLTKEHIDIDGYEYATYVYEYETTDTYADVVAFYIAAGCREYDWPVCIGNASPFGDYELYIKDESPGGNVTYHLQVEWDRCYRWKETVVEDAYRNP